ncbi:HesA/MoeB/ThiF family protein [Salinibacterium sp. SWN139]|uniref:HesA/MoeB/ThiF family protein n=1 Tax=Salinibacterium sp. SWN139 TaxID=2792055 RepID=UPI0018CF1882|nr:HesA/MoeB/ThiF family protein [Salinibacterium sp. SWN139]MBH0053637.1 HesA/MoeB/ThiF family protein [Salinibacterium sp. SWN139]
MDQRFSRQLALTHFGETAQKNLARARVLVIGAGGVGSTVIPSLAAAGVGTVGVIDDDRVELSNLHRQHIHRLLDVGYKKVVSAVERVAELSPATTVIAIDAKLTPHNALELFAEYDLVVDGSDNFATHYLAADAAEITGIPLIWGIACEFGSQAGVSWPARGAGFRDLYPLPPEAATVDTNVTHGIFPGAVSVVASIVTSEAIKITAQIGTTLLNRATNYDALAGEFSEERFERAAAAPAITELADYRHLLAYSPLDEWPTS